MAECLSALLCQPETPAPSLLETSLDESAPKMDKSAEDWVHPEVDPELVAEWEWHPPDLSEGSRFCHVRLETLKWVTKECNGPNKWTKDGIKLLCYHCQNCGPNGPKRLTVL